MNDGVAVKMRGVGNAKQNQGALSDPKAVLAEKGKTNNWLADQLDNEMQPRVETLFQIAKVLEVDVRVLLVSTLS